MGKTLRTLIVITTILILSATAYAADFDDYYSGEEEEPPSPDKVTLNADRVSFNDETGHAYAQGNAVLTYQDTTIMAERIEYDADTQKVQAMPLPGSQIVLTNGDRSIRGDQLEYDLNSREGVLSGAATRLPVGEDGGVLYVYGSEINVVPWELAKERGLVKGDLEEYMLQWRDVVLTTCTLDHPHYRLESKAITFIPGRSGQYLPVHLTARLRRPAQTQSLALLVRSLLSAQQLQRHRRRRNCVSRMGHRSSIYRNVLRQQSRF